MNGNSAVGPSAADGLLLKPFNSHQLPAALDRLRPQHPEAP
jgi:hypothetical protein